MSSQANAQWIDKTFAWCAKLGGPANVALITCGLDALLQPAIILSNKKEDWKTRKSSALRGLATDGMAFGLTLGGKLLAEKVLSKKLLGVITNPEAREVVQQTISTGVVFFIDLITPALTNAALYKMHQQQKAVEKKQQASAVTTLLPTLAQGDNANITYPVALATTLIGQGQKRLQNTAPYFNPYGGRL